MNRLILPCVILFLVSCTEQEKRFLQLAPLFSDHMVLQQQDTIRISGLTNKGTNIQVEASWGTTMEVTASSDGNWSGRLITPEAGGPHSIKIVAGDTAVTINDVYLGEVWLASGQSNMEMPLRGWPPNDTINYSAREISNANDALIRMFTVERAVSDTLLHSVKGDWKVCSPETAGSFSATAYFFARKLRAELNVPIGIVHSSWGGTPAEAWVSKESLEGLGDFKAELEKISISPEERKKIREWTNGLEVIDVSSSAMAEAGIGDTAIPSPTFDDSAWRAMELPRLWEASDVGAFDGVVWYRKEFTVQDPAGDYTITLGPIDDMDITYINGTEVGRIAEEGHWQADRVYKIPSGTLQKGKNIVAVKVMDPRGGGGIYGAPEKLSIKGSGENVSLAGTWKYLPVAEFKNDKLYLYGVENSKYDSRPKSIGTTSPNSPTMLYNAMIHPLKHYAFRGVIWYQGESNVGRAEQYERLFPLLIQDWRKQLQDSHLPFYFVQIAPYTYGGGQSAQSAALRDAQRKTLSVANTGMVVTLDIGNNTNIHPGNKQDVGERLARLALGNVYDVAIPYSGPLVRNARLNGNTVTVEFDFAEGLTLKENSAGSFEMAGPDDRFYKATAKVEGDKLLLSSSQVKEPATIRYAWSDTAAAALFNADGLPASSFLVTIKK